MHRRTIRAGLVTAGALWATVLAAQKPASNADLVAILDRVAERVERYFSRAQSIVCIESVQWQPLDMGFGADGLPRQVESELALSWGGSDQPAAEAKTLRRVLKVNGRPPRPHDPNNCTSPEQTDTETQPLSMLLTGQRGDYTFTLAGRGTQDGRDALLLDFSERSKPTVESTLIEDNENCLSYSINGGSRGRIWVDAGTFDVLRMDKRLAYVEVPLPWKLARRFPGSRSWTLERSDTTIRFKGITFRDPDEVLVLPVSMSELRVMRGDIASRLRTTTEFTAYRRFLTGGRVVR